MAVKINMALRQKKMAMPKLLQQIFTDVMPKP
jgi:hypothetical protein